VLAVGTWKISQSESLYGREGAGGKSKREIEILTQLGGSGM